MTQTEPSPDERDETADKYAVTSLEEWADSDLPGADLAASVLERRDAMGGSD